MPYRLLLLIAFLGPCAVASALDEDDLSAKVDAIFSEYDSAGEPGCAVGVIADGEYIHARGYGLANLEHGIPINRDSVFRIGSVSKQFTAAAIAILATRGDLDLDADVHDYLPDLGKYAAPVTIRQMIHHISGMGDYETNPHYEVAPGKLFRFGNEDYWTIGEFYQRVRNEPLVLIPGQRFEYSNTAYFLLSQVVERVSGQSLREFADKEMFGPLEMQATFFNDNVDGVVRNRADGYAPRQGGGFEISMTNLDWVGDGGVYTTLNDLIKWDRAFTSGNVPGGVGVQRLMQEPHPLTEKTMTSYLLDDGAGYGFGLEIGNYRGRTAHSHTGSWVGYRSLYTRFPDDRVSAIVMCNRSDVAEDGDKRKKMLDVIVATISRSQE